MTKLLKMALSRNTYKLECSAYYNVFLNNIIHSISRLIFIKLPMVFDSYVYYIKKPVKSNSSRHDLNTSFFIK